MRTYLRILFFLLVLLQAIRVDSQPANFNELDTYIEQAVSDYNLTGLTIAVVRGSSVVFKQAYGMKNRETQEAMTTDALFNIASCSKAFTGATVAMLVHEGKLDWRDKVIDYLPEFRLAEPYITHELNLIDILSHRSGLDTFYGDLLWYGTDYGKPEIIHRMRYLPIKNDFRSEYGYQNNMFLIAGEIVEKVAGKSWSDFVYERLFQPLDMTESRTCSGDLTAEQPIAYPHIEDQKLEPMFPDPNPAGSIFSNVEEMSHWVTMLLNRGQWQGNEVLSLKVISELFTPRIVFPRQWFLQESETHFRAYGLGWFLYDYAGKMVVEHGGGMPGYISKVMLVPEEKLGVVVLTNDISSLPDALGKEILDRFVHDSGTDWAERYLTHRKNRETAKAQKQAERKAKRAKNTKPSLALKEYTGMYEDEMYGPAQVELRDDALHLTLLPTKEIFTSEMQHWHHDTFRIKFKDEFLPEGFVTFHFNANGEVTRFIIDLPNPDFHFFNLDFVKETEK